MYQELLREKAELLKNGSPVLDITLVADMLEAVATDIDIRFVNPVSNTGKAAKALAESIISEQV